MPKTTNKVVPMRERVHSYEDACAIKGIKPLTLEDFAFLPENERQYHYSLHKILTVQDVFKEGRTFNWNDYNQEKRFPVWDMETYNDGRKDDGFSLYFVYHSYFVGTGVGSRLCSFTREDAEYIATLMKEDYKQIMK